MKNENEEKPLWSARVPKDFREWAEKRINEKGINKALCTVAAVYYIISLPDKDREQVIKAYNNFVNKGLPLNKKGLSPLEEAFEKAVKIVPVGVLGKKGGGTKP